MGLPSSWGVKEGGSLKKTRAHWKKEPIVWPYALKATKGFCRQWSAKDSPQDLVAWKVKKILTMEDYEWKPVNNLLTCHSMEPPPLEIQLSTELSHAHKS